MEVFMGTIMPFGFPFAPSGWQLCNGQTISLQQYTALFALIGTTYGGNGQQNFMLPNLQGRFPIGQGTGQSLTVRPIGQVSGSESVSVLISNLPAHNHPGTGLTATTTVNVAGAGTSQTTAPSTTNPVLGASTGGPGAADIWSTAMTGPVALQGVTTAVAGVTGIAGQGLPVAIMNPFLAINFSIAMTGIYPSRN